jgi:oxygen-independent coproporphyrinogen III oxidase
LSIGIYLSFPFSKPPVKGLGWGAGAYQAEIARDYLQSLLKEIESSPFKGQKVSTLLLGAGDWSLVPPDFFKQLIRVLSNKFRFISKSEFTLEVSPADLSLKKIRLFRQFGVNRASLNLFRFNYPGLKNTVSNLKKAGIRNFNFDLYFGQPGQTLSSWKKDLQRITSLKPAHLSLYSYGSVRKQPHLKGELYSMAQDYLVKKGYQQYEICHFCCPGFEAKQNLLYWKRKKFLGFGAGAASLWNNRRWQNPRNIRTYMKFIQSGKNSASSAKRLTQEEEQAEVIYHALRQTAGLDLKKFQQVYGSNLYSSKKRIIDTLIEKGYLSRKGNRLVLTKEAYLSADDLIAELI